MSTQSLSEHADEQSRRPWFRFVARAGMAARGVIFPIIGVLAIRVATDSGGETTDQEGALSALAEQRFGGFLLALLTLGLAGYALWRFAQGLLDTDDKGDDEKAWAMRAGKLGSGVVYAILCVTALQILMGSGGGGSGSGDPKSTTAGVLGWPGGQVWVALSPWRSLASPPGTSTGDNSAPWAAHTRRRAHRKGQWTVVHPFGR